MMEDPSAESRWNAISNEGDPRKNLSSQAQGLRYQVLSSNMGSKFYDMTAQGGSTIDTPSFSAIKPGPCACKPWEPFMMPARTWRRLAAFFCSPSMLAAMKGEVYDCNWWEKLYLHPVVRAWTALLHRYEGVSEIANTNIVKVILELLESTKHKSVYAIDEQFRIFLHPLAIHFSSVADFTNFLAANLRATVIQRCAQGDTPQA